MRPDAVHAVIAVKNLDRAKSRLAGRLPAADRSRLVLAMLCDTVTAALDAGLGSVTVVTPDERVAAAVRALGASVHPDPLGPTVDAAALDSPAVPTTRSGTTPSADSDGLNTALASAAAAVRERHGAVDLLALQADLPALRADDLIAMLTAAPTTGRAVVVDHTGLGTAALLVRASAGAGARHPAGSPAIDPSDTDAATVRAEPASAHPLAPRFGPDSARRHRESGAVELIGGWPGLRLDVDTAEDLDRAAALGVGAATARLLRDIDWPVAVHEKLIRRCATPSHVC